RRARVGKRIELVEGQADDLARAHADIHQPLDRAKLRGFRGSVLTLAVVVARRPGKTVAALPHAQHILREAGLALDRTDVLREIVPFFVLHHRTHASDCPAVAEQVSYCLNAPSRTTMQRKRTGLGTIGIAAACVALLAVALALMDFIGRDFVAD